MIEHKTYKIIDEKDEIFQKIETYSQLLKRQEWKDVREIIKSKSNYQCIKCKKWETLNLNGTPFGSLSVLGKGLNDLPIYKLEKAPKNISFHIHHTFYVLDRMPWQYNENDLMCLCPDCHMDIHNTLTIKVYLTEYDRKLEKCSKLITCPKCGGDGYLDEYSYHENGVCFSCNGRCFVRVFHTKSYEP